MKNPEDQSNESIFNPIPLSLKLMYQGTSAIGKVIDMQRDLILDSAVSALRDDYPLSSEARIKYFDNRGRLRVDFTESL